MLSKTKQKMENKRRIRVTTKKTEIQNENESTAQVEHHL